jgi:hypothetical protein
MSFAPQSNCLQGPRFALTGDMASVEPGRFEDGPVNAPVWVRVDAMHWTNFCPLGVGGAAPEAIQFKVELTHPDWELEMVGWLFVQQTDSVVNLAFG